MSLLTYMTIAVTVAGLVVVAGMMAGMMIIATAIRWHEKKEIK